MENQAGFKSPGRYDAVLRVWTPGQCGIPGEAAAPVCCTMAMSPIVLAGIPIPNYGSEYVALHHGFVHRGHCSPQGRGPARNTATVTPESLNRIAEVWVVLLLQKSG